MKLDRDEKGWYWIDGNATSQSFPSQEEAESAMIDEENELKRLGLDSDSLASAGIIKWE